MRRVAWFAVMLLLFMRQGPLRAQEAGPDDVRGARIWLDRGDEPVVQRGEQVRVYYRASHDSYTAIFHIDTDGSVKLVHPAAPDEDHYIRGGRDYRLLFPRSPYWNVDEDPGVGYYFLVASPEPFDFSSFEYARYDRGWDLTRVGRAVYDDPYLAMDDYVAALVPDWEYVPYTLDFISYNVGSTHDYPRFMCYQCHGFRSYAEWNPYQYACTDFRVVIWDDPYFYPAYRYSGTRVVYATPLRARPRFGFTARLAGQPWAPVVRQRDAPPSRMVQYKEAPMARSSVTPPVQRRMTPSDQVRPGAVGRSTRASVSPPPSSERRATPSRALTVPKTRAAPTTRAVPGSRTAPTPRSAAPSATSQRRPVLQRRPGSITGGGTSGRTSTGSRPAVARPTTSSRPTRAVAPLRGQTRTPTANSRPPTRRAPTVRPGTTSGRRPSVKPSARPPQARVRPAVRPTVRPTVRPRSGGTTSRARPPVRRRGGGK